MRAYCESRYETTAANGIYDGLYQFEASTWNTTPYHKQSVWSAKWSALAAAWMEHEGQGSQWQCTGEAW
jgi:hypothetical protein